MQLFDYTLFIMLRLRAFFRSLTWLALGTIFGLGSFILIIMSSQIFGNSCPNFTSLVNHELIIYLCLALMCGAGSDFALSQISTWSIRVLIFIIVILLLFVICFVFSPNNKYPPTHLFVNGITITYISITVAYCLSLKSILFYQEQVAHKKLQNSNI